MGHDIIRCPHPVARGFKARIDLADGLEFEIVPDFGNLFSFVKAKAVVVLGVDGERGFGLIGRPAAENVLAATEPPADRIPDPADLSGDFGAESKKPKAEKSTSPDAF